MPRRRPLPSIVANARPFALLQALEARRLLAVNILFDYSLDSSNFFSDPVRRATLQAAADAIVSGMTDSLSAILPGGGNTYTATFTNPATGAVESVTDRVIPADTIIVYVGARDLDAPVLGLGGYAGWSGNGSPAFLDALATRGQPGANGPNPTDFAPFIGSIAFDSIESFNFEESLLALDPGENDFYSLVQHELFHVLGFPGSDSFNGYVSGTNFEGPAVTALLGGPAPLEADAKHFAEGTSFGGQEALMDPSITVGDRKTATALDFAALQDIGWSFEPFATIVASDDEAGEPNNNGKFTVSHNGDTSSSVTIEFEVAGSATRGTDYTLSVGGTTLLGNSVTIPANQSSIDIDVIVIDDSISEVDEEVTLTLLPGSGYLVAHNNASANIVLIDDDVRVSVSAFDPGVSEPGNDGVLRVSRTGSANSDLVVSFTLGGTAATNQDYFLSNTAGVPLDGYTITIPSGAEYVDIIINVIDDNVVENTETLIFTLTTQAGDYAVVNGTTTIFISDDDRRPAAINVNAAGSGTTDLNTPNAAFSGDGRYAVFVSNSTNVANAPLTTYYQVYRRDLVLGVTQLVSVATDGKSESNGDAVFAAISADGRYVVYETLATNVIRNADKNEVNDIYWRDMVTNETILITRGGEKSLAASLVNFSSDGQKVLFTSRTKAGVYTKGIADNNNAADLFVWDRSTSRIDPVSVTPNRKQTGNRVSESNDVYDKASFSLDGNLVLFPSRASNLVNGVTDGNTYQTDLFIRNLRTKQTQYVTISTNPSASGKGISGYGEISADGSKVVFRSAAPDLVATDTNGQNDIFVRDLLTGTTKLLSTNAANTDSAAGTASRPDMTSDGRYVVFSTSADNMIATGDTNNRSDIYRIDVQTGEKLLVSVNANGTNGGRANSTEAQITNNGNVVVFASYADDLPTNFNKPNSTFAAMYARNLTTGESTVVSLDRGNNPARANSGAPFLSTDGTRIGYYSDSPFLINGDSNNTTDIFTISTPGNEVAFLDHAGRLTIRGSTLDDVINVQRVSNKIVVVRNQEKFEYKTSEVKAIDILAGDGDDNVLIGTTMTLGVYVSAGSGNDRVIGGGGRDVIQGGPGRDYLSGGEGDDRIDGGKGNDTIFGDGGKDRLFGGDGNDVIDGGGGADRLFDGLGSDTYRGGSGDDRFYSFADGATDFFYGNAGNDTMIRTSSDPSDILDSIENLA